MVEFEERENQRNAAEKGSPQEQFEKYMNKWRELWRKCQIKGREKDVEQFGDNILGVPGAIPLQKWEDYLKIKIAQGNMYEAEGILQIMEQIAVNGDYKKALQIFDELSVSITDLDRIGKDVMEYLPRIPTNIATHPDIGKERTEAKYKFELRATEKASSERRFIRKEKITIEKAIKNALKSGITKENISEIPSENTNEKGNSYDK